MAQDTVDLTALDSDDESPAEAASRAAAREAAQRQSIMEFARARARQRSAGQDAEQPSNSAAAEAATATAAEAEGQPPKRRCRPDDAADASANPDSSNAGSTLHEFGNDELRALHEERMQRLRARQASADPPGAAAAAAASGVQATAAAPSFSRATASRATAVPDRATAAGSREVSLLTYNIWFREDIALQQRMQGVADVIESSGYPTFVCLQEVTPKIMRILSRMPWWQRYACSPEPSFSPYFTLLLVNKSDAPTVSSSCFEEVAFDNSSMGRSLRVASVKVKAHTLLVATSHLESPIPPTQWYSRERQQQMRFSLAQLDKSPYSNILFAGDMNWTDSRDGPPPLPPNWADAWQQLHPDDPGFTYDSRNNPMLAYKNPGLRLDRIFARLSDFRLEGISIVGTQQLAGASYTHTFRNGGSKQLPVLPSDHFGLLLKLQQL